VKFDNYCDRLDNYISLERIQDIDVSQNFCEKCWGVRSIYIATAGGTPIAVHGLKDTEQFRKEVVLRRDRVVHGQGVRDDGTGGLHHAAGGNFSIPSSAEIELREMKECLLRIERIGEDIKHWNSSKK